MATNNTTFWNLLNSNKISIPIIQRDYAQGREEEFEKREKFLNAIFKHLTNSEKLHLDFVYGNVKDNTFFPIDGQQRLTTLFLLHWYFAVKENISNENKMKLKQFVYDTRISSREFCHTLIKENIEVPLTNYDDAFIKSIKNESWYRDKWNTDPTIKAMLVMIQDIHNKFYNIGSTSVFTQLINENTISFELLDLGSKGFELTDELYIKMNARGKQLTSFENFKANFIQFIERKYKGDSTNHPIKGEISYSGYFSYKVEKEWTDLFWTFRGEKKTVDESFSNYFEFITEMLFFKKYKDVKADAYLNSFHQYEDVYGEKENLVFLFDSLDQLYNVLIKSGRAEIASVRDLFNSISSVTSFFDKVPSKFCLFERILLNVRKEDVKLKILLFCIIHYLVKYQIIEYKDHLGNFIRVVRNFLQAIRQRNETTYNSNIRVNNFGNYWQLFSQIESKDVYSKLKDPLLINKGTLISDPSLVNEIEKAQILEQNDHASNKALLDLEENEYFGGLIHQLKPQVNQSNLPKYAKAIKEIWNDSISDTLRIQALIACGFEGLKIRGTKMGETTYFGRKENWNVILACEDENISRCILSLLNRYTLSTATNPYRKLQDIVNGWLAANLSDRSFKYYFLKYSDFTSKLNYFVKLDSFEIRLLGTEGSNPLLAYHISPFVLTVCRKINDLTICDEKQCYLQYSGNSPLILKNGITMNCINEGWEISSTSIISDSIINKYNLVDLNGNYILKDNDEMDRIEIAIDFINEIYKS